MSDLVIALVVIVKYIMDELTLRWRDEIVPAVGRMGGTGGGFGGGGGDVVVGNSSGLLGGPWSISNASVSPPVYGGNVGAASVGVVVGGQAYIGETHAVYCVHMVLRSISVSAMNITLLNLLGYCVLVYIYIL